MLIKPNSAHRRRPCGLPIQLPAEAKLLHDHEHGVRRRRQGICIRQAVRRGHQRPDSRVLRIDEGVVEAVVHHAAGGARHRERTVRVGLAGHRAVPLVRHRVVPGQAAEHGQLLGQLRWPVHPLLSHSHHAVRVVESLSMLRGSNNKPAGASSPVFFRVRGLLHLKSLQPCEKVSFFTPWAGAPV